MSPLSLDNGWTDHNADCCVKTSVKGFVMATNFVVRDGDKLAYIAFIVLC